MKAPARPDFYRSPSGRIWTVMTYFNMERMKGVWWPEPDESGDITPEINDRRCRILHTCVLHAHALAPDSFQEDYVALVRVEEDAEGFPRLLMTCQALSRMRASKWKSKTPRLALDDPSRSFTIEGESASVDQMHISYAIMRWDFDLDGYPRREWLFPLWRWQLCLAALGPVSFEMMGETFDAQEAEI